MGNAVATLQVMPISPDVDMDALEKRALKAVRSFNGGKDTKVQIVPIAFGLKSINITFVMEESLGSPDPLAETVGQLEDVNSAQITDVRRAIG